MTIEEAEKKCRKTDIKLKDYQHDPNLTLNKFVYLFLTNFCNRYITIHSITGTSRCKLRRSRTLQDAWRLCVYYYPGTTLKEVKEIVIDYINKGLLSCLYCYDIERMTYYKAHQGYQHKDNTRDEFDMCWYDI